MPRTERYPHFVRKTNKDHICNICGGIIPKGSQFVRYKNMLSGKREYYHNECPQEIIDENRRKIWKINHPDEDFPE